MAPSSRRLWSPSPRGRILHQGAPSLGTGPQSFCLRACPNKVISHLGTPSAGLEVSGTKIVLVAVVVVAVGVSTSSPSSRCARTPRALSKREGARWHRAPSTTRCRRCSTSRGSRWPSRGRARRRRQQKYSSSRRGCVRSASAGRDREVQDAAAVGPGRDVLLRVRREHAALYHLHGVGDCPDRQSVYKETHLGVHNILESE